MKASGAILVLIVFIVLFGVAITPRVLNIQKLEARSKALQDEIRKMQSENQALENELRLLREDPVYLEKVAREKFNKAKQGEIVYKVVRQGENVE
jgi:cell division protein FtsB